jgi:hypothetical protein
VDRASGTHAGLEVTVIAPHDGPALVNRLAKDQEVELRNSPTGSASDWCNDSGVGRAWRKGPMRDCCPVRGSPSARKPSATSLTLWGTSQGTVNHSPSEWWLGEDR